MRICLRDYIVHKTPSLLTALHDDIGIVWRDHDQWKQSNMICQLIVFLFISLKLLLLVSFKAAGDFLILFQPFKISLNHEKILVRFDLLTIYWIEISLA